MGKLYLLRHEQRGDDISFESRLTLNGLKNSKNIVCPALENLSIDIIYCSPFIRTLQTIQPFCYKTGKKINIEWSIVESFPHNPIISKEFTNIINHEYKSHIPYTHTTDQEIIYFEHLRQQVKRFILSLDHSKNILIVTHMPVINAILSSIGINHIDMYTYHKPGSIISVNSM